jgi:hypothetical protein
MLRRVALFRTDVSEELSASFIRVTGIGELGTTLAVTNNRPTLRRNTKWATSVLTRATRRNIPEDAILHSYRRKNLKSYRECDRSNLNVRLILDMKTKQPANSIRNRTSQDIVWCKLTASGIAPRRILSGVSYLDCSSYAALSSWTRQFIIMLSTWNVLLGSFLRQSHEHSWTSNPSLSVIC